MKPRNPHASEYTRTMMRGFHAAVSKQLIFFESHRAIVPTATASQFQALGFSRCYEGHAVCSGPWPARGRGCLPRSLGSWSHRAIAAAEPGPGESWKGLDPRGRAAQQPKASIEGAGLALFMVPVLDWFEGNLQNTPVLAHTLEVLQVGVFINAALRPSTLRASCATLA